MVEHNVKREIKLRNAHRFFWSIGELQLGILVHSIPFSIYIDIDCKQVVVCH